MSGEREVWWVEEYEGVQFLVSGNSPAEALIMGMPAAAAELNRLLNAYQDAVAALEKIAEFSEDSGHIAHAALQSIKEQGA